MMRSNDRSMGVNDSRATTAAVLEVRLLCSVHMPKMKFWMVNDQLPLKCFEEKHKFAGLRHSAKISLNRFVLSFLNDVLVNCISYPDIVADFTMRRRTD